MSNLISKLLEPYLIRAIHCQPRPVLLVLRVQKYMQSDKRWRKSSRWAWRLKSFCVHSLVLYYAIMQMNIYVSLYVSSMCGLVSCAPVSRPGWSFSLWVAVIIPSCSVLIGKAANAQAVICPTPLWDSSTVCSVWSSDCESTYVTLRHSFQWGRNYCSSLAVSFVGVCGNFYLGYGSEVARGLLPRVSCDGFLLWLPGLAANESAHKVEA